MKSVVVLVTALMGLAAPSSAQVVVIDPGHLAQAVVIAARTLREYEVLTAQYQTILRMSKRLGDMEGYRVPTVPTSRHDPTQWDYGRSWVNGLNVGDPAGSGYQQSTRTLEPPRNSLAGLPAKARRAVEQAYATVEIADAVTQAGGHDVGTLRAYTERLQQAIDALESEVVRDDAGTHEMTAILDKVAAGAVIARRQDTATNQLLSAALEQLLVRGKRLRDTEAATMNMRLGGMQYGRTAGTSVVAGAADDLRTWRQP